MVSTIYQAIAWPVVQAGLAQKRASLSILRYTKKGKAMNHKTVVAAFIFTAALSTSLQAVEVSKDAWISSMTSILPTAFLQFKPIFQAVLHC